MNSNTVALAGLALVILAAYLAMREHQWLRNAEVVPGEVIALVASRGSKGGTVYAPLVRFTAHDKTVHEFKRSYSSSSPGFKVGDPVWVAYHPDSYHGRMLTFGQRFGLPVTLAVLGLATFCLCAAFKIGREYVPRIYLSSRQSQRSHW